ncbi:MAG: AbrB/MazE/SpoVT family DNA-binding domain-containing protein [Candidatus Bathyarchaeia archaeon]
MMERGKIGSKGELFPPKRIRAKLGLKPNSEVLYKVEGGRLIVEPIPSLEEALEGEPSVRIRLEDFERFREGLSKGAEG